MESLPSLSRFTAISRDVATAARRALSAAARSSRGAPAFDADALDARDPELIREVLPLARLLARHYVRLSVEGLEHLGRAPALYVSNHNGGLSGPDVACTLATLWDTVGPEHPLYALAHDFAMRHVRPFGAFIQRFGAVRAAQENAERALRAGAQVLVYPGGDIEAYRAFHRRDEIVFGQRSGFVRLAQRVGVPIVPIVAQGAHRSARILTDGERIARRLQLKRWARVERFPIALSVPWGLTLGPWLPYFPLPFSIRLRVLPPLTPAMSDDPQEVREEVRRQMQRALDELAQRAPAAAR